MTILVEIDGKLQEVTKRHLFFLAETGTISPDTRILVDGKESVAGKAVGIKFGTLLAADIDIAPKKHDVKKSKFCTDCGQLIEAGQLCSLCKKRRKAEAKLLREGRNTEADQFHSSLSDDVEINRVSKQNFDKIKVGMSYKTVTEILGSPTQTLSEVEMGGYKTSMYQWDDGLGFGGNMNITLQNGKVIGKAQFGLSDNLLAVGEEAGIDLASTPNTPQENTAGGCCGCLFFLVLIFLLVAGYSSCRDSVKESEADRQAAYHAAVTIHGGRVSSPTPLIYGSYEEADVRHERDDVYRVEGVAFEKSRREPPIRWTVLVKKEGGQWTAANK